MKRKRLDTQLVDKAHEDGHQLSPTCSVEYLGSKKIRLQEIAERVNESVPHCTAVMRDKRKKGKKAGKRNGRELIHDEQVEAHVNKGYANDDYRFIEKDMKRSVDLDLDLEVELKEDL